MAVDMESAQQMVERPIERLENLSPTAYFAGVLGSIALSLGLFLFGKRQWSLFVGLWAPTILNAGLFMKLLRPSQEMRR
ncbi:MAG: hypothetical protein GX774_07465 [Armatimonadetes bacterium]|jgi:hypothetical protein|nr:hypothetical protein [Armatimonadota bacterium]